MSDTYDSYDLYKPSQRVFVRDWPGGGGAAADSRSPLPSRRSSTMSPERGKDNMALVLRSGQDFERLRRKAKRHAAAARRRRSSTRGKDRSEEVRDLEEEEGAGDRRDGGDGSGTEGGKATVTDLEDGEESESEVPERFQEFFNQDYKPPVADAVNGASEEKVE
ncbi:hypothetical protein SLS58_000056 [Diplodia intermedia]|uniref:Uncharacterized protein n=1 Tax=Diplodia intermedia TaxID=856260 RepID=A0ABR3U4N5_9PEZI